MTSDREPIHLRVDVGAFRPQLMALMRATKTFRSACVEAKSKGEELDTVDSGLLPKKIAHAIRRIVYLNESDMPDSRYDAVYPLPTGTWRAAMNGITFATGHRYRRAVALILDAMPDSMDDSRVAYLSIQGDTWVLTCRPA